MLHASKKYLAAGAVALSLGLAPAGAVAQDFINVLTGGTSGLGGPRVSVLVWANGWRARTIPWTLH